MTGREIDPREILLVLRLWPFMWWQKTLTQILAHGAVAEGMLINPDQAPHHVRPVRTGAIAQPPPTGRYVHHIQPSD